MSIRNAAIADIRSISVCVFCASSNGVDESLLSVAKQVGTLLGTRGHHLIYGGGGSGLMGGVAWSAHEHGATVTGVIPKFLYEREKGIAAPQQEVHLSESMADRKTEMFARADAFIALPGGYGTLDEIFEVLSLNYLGVLNKPIIVVGEVDIWRHLTNLVDKIHENGFVRPGYKDRLRVVADAESAIDLVEQMCSGGV